MNNIFTVSSFHKPKKPYVAMDNDRLRLVGEINQRITKKEIEFELVPCLCSGVDFELIASVDRYAVLQDTVICKKCGLIQCNPRMTPSYYQWLYTSDVYRQLYESLDYVEVYQEKAYNLEAGQFIFNKINGLRKIESKLRIVEYGAGGGWNLVAFDRAGWRSAKAS